MSNPGGTHKTRARRPFWLLFALVLFLAGQVATAAHWHHNLNKVDTDCALCMLSSANSGAIIDSTLPFIAFAVGVVVFLFTLPPVCGVSSRCYDSRAPPIYF